MNTIYLSNWSSYRTPGMHGPGRKWTIMASPRAWERGEGRVAALAPITETLRPLVDAALAERRFSTIGGPALDTYRAAYGAWLRDCPTLTPGFLRAYRWDAMRHGDLVEDGATLCCACAVREALEGRCHRAWAAPFLVRAGWRVILDGVEVAGG